MSCREKTFISWIVINLRHLRSKFALITSRNEVVAKVMFLHVSVILLTGGGLPQCMLGSPQEQTPPRPDPPGNRHPPEQTPPQSRHPPEQTHPQSRHTPEADSGIQSMSGWYASYWNAFLFKVCLHATIFSPCPLLQPLLNVFFLLSSE